ncbi:hypothetical protein ACOME3_000629 [Neoechinorhynchus agilis]
MAAIKMSYTSTSAAAATGDDKQSSPAPTAPPNAPVQSPKSTYSYKSNITPRSTMVQRRSGATGISGQLPQMMTRVSHSVVSGPSGYAPSSSSAYGTLSSLVSAGVPMRPRGTGGMVALNETREREKRELSLLNDKFAQYVEKVRFLEAQNKKLQLELEALQNKAGQGSSRIKEMYEIEMQEARKLIDDTGRDRADAEVKAREAEQEASQLKKRYQDALASRSSDRQQIDAIEQEIAENEAKINLLRRRLTDIEDEGRRFKAESQRLINEISRLGNELQNESFAKSTLEAEKMGLEDELNMLRQMHEAELNDMRSKTVVDVGLDPSHFFRNELANAIREIRAEYENATEQQRSELHNRYMMHYNELVMRHQRPELDPNQYEQHRLQEQKLQVTLKTTRNESAHMKARNEQLAERIREIQSMLENEKDEGERLVRSREKELSDLKSRLDELLKEYDDVSNTKTSLEKEISQYRELLEGTMNRDGLRQVVEHIEEEARKLESERLTNAITSGPSLYSSSSSTRYITSPMGQGVGSAVSSLGGLGGGNTKPSAYSRTYQTPKDLN